MGEKLLNKRALRTLVCFHLPKQIYFRIGYRITRCLDCDYIIEQLCSLHNNIDCEICQKSFSYQEARK